MATHREIDAQSAGRIRKPSLLRRREGKTRTRGAAVLAASAAIAAIAVITAMGYYAAQPAETARRNFAACVSAVEHEQQQANATIREKEKTADTEQKLAALAQCTDAQ